MGESLADCSILTHLSLLLLGPTLPRYTPIFLTLEERLLFSAWMPMERSLMAATSNNALERTVEERGPRLAWESGQCAAAQLGR
jgi:hypothetical protein